MIAVECGWRDMKGALGLRPVFHYREDRIRAHIQLCWLALLLIRVTENATAGNLPVTRAMKWICLHLVTLATPDGRVAERSAATPAASSTSCVPLTCVNCHSPISPPRWGTNRRPL